MGITIGTPLPHGGKLVDRVVTNPAKGKKMAKHCDAVFDIKPTLSDNGVPLRNVYREIMSTCYGFFSPVEGSMTKAEGDKVVKEKRLRRARGFSFSLVFGIKW